MFDEARKNKIRSWLLISIFIILIGVLGSVIGLIYDNFYIGLALALVFASMYSLIGFYSGNQMILSMTGAKEAIRKEYPYLINTVEGLAIAANIPPPKTYIIEDSALNAFATGRDPRHASITVTTGLLKAMNRQELEGVVAHEMSHIRNYDIRLMMLVAVLVGIVTLLSDFLLRSFLWGGKGGRRDSKLGNIGLILIIAGFLLAILTPIIGQLVHLAISRKREYLADSDAAILTRYPPGLASALKKIAKDPDPLVDTANRATAHLFISTPFRESSFITNLFSTHPPIKERISILESM